MKKYYSIVSQTVLSLSKELNMQNEIKIFPLIALIQGTWFKHFPK